MPDGILVKLLAKLGSYLAVKGAKAGAARLLSQSDTSKAIEAALDATEKDFPDEEIRYRLRKWVESDSFRKLLEELKAGGRGYTDGEIVDSFYRITESYSPDGDQTAVRELLQVFTQNLLDEISKSALGRVFDAARQEVLHGATHQQLQETLGLLNQLKAFEEQSQETSQKERQKILKTIEEMGVLVKQLASESRAKHKKTLDMMEALVSNPNDPGKENLRIGIVCDPHRTYFYVPRGDRINFYSDEPGHQKHSYSVFSFEFQVSASNITIHEVDAMIYHPWLGRWEKLSDCKDLWGFPEGYDKTIEYIREFTQGHLTFSPARMGWRDSRVLSIPKCGYHAQSLERGSQSILYAVLTFHINTSYLSLLCQIPELGVRPELSVAADSTAILSFRQSDDNNETEIKAWVTQNLTQADELKKSRVIVVEQGMS